jgi:hypothetical protein
LRKNQVKEAYVQIGKDGFFHLTYCTKIHPSHGWEELFDCIQAHVPALKGKLAPARPFGLGLRLSATESQELLIGDDLPRFQDFLDRHDIYVFTLNGFPYGPFRGPSIKAEVFAPDWRDEARVAYTERLIGILATLLPAGMEGSISTLPLSYKPWIAQGDPGIMEQISRNLTQIVRVLMQVREEQGKFIHLDLEPEANGLLENSHEAVDFFHKWLLPQGAPLLAGWSGISQEQARTGLLDHVQICLDTCHLAVAYEDPGEVLELFYVNGIQVGKVQVTSGLKVIIPGGQEERQALTGDLEAFGHSPYLHQVLAQREDGTFYLYHDLNEALSKFDSLDQEWRIHFHMPLYAKGFAGLSSTQEETCGLLRLLKERRFCRHLELETYTWEVLPPAMQLDILECLEKEYRWTLQVLDLEE